MKKQEDQMIDKLIEGIYHKDTNKIEELLHSGTDINILDKDGRNLLMHAILDSDTSIDPIQFFINKGIDVNHHDFVQEWRH